ncbi:MAG TPA: DUF2914 domain-containing protein [Acidiferrobacter sp.]|nr:DUF2914 domain-containing protein [Acidiferrobacter sp.]
MLNKTAQVSFMLTVFGGVLAIPAVAGMVVVAPANAKVAATATVTAKATVYAPTVARAVFALGIEGRTAINPVTTLQNNVPLVYYFTDLRNMTGQTVSHRWAYNGTVVATVSFHVRGPRWRVWSTKRLLPSQLGKWTVTVVDGQGHALAQSSLSYVKAVSQAPASPALASPTPATQPTAKTGP